MATALLTKFTTNTAANTRCERKRKKRRAKLASFELPKARLPQAVFHDEFRFLRFPRGSKAQRFIQRPRRVGALDTAKPDVMVFTAPLHPPKELPCSFSPNAAAAEKAACKRCL